MLYGVVLVVCVARVCVIVYRVLGCCVCGLLCDDVCCASFVFLLVCLISMVGCCVRDLLSDAVWLLLFVLLCLCAFV